MISRDLSLSCKKRADWTRYWYFNCTVADEDSTCQQTQLNNRDSNMAATVSPAPSGFQPAIRELVEKILALAPARKSASAGELRAQQILADEFRNRGLPVEWQSFRCANNLYAVLALHFALAVLGSALYLVAPWMAAGMHAFTIVSFVLESHYWGFWLRGLLPTHPSQNLIARLPAAAERVRKRVVFISHADAAPTGWMFAPIFLHTLYIAWPNWLWPLRKQMLLSMLSLATLIAFDIVLATGTQLTAWPYLAVYYVLTLASAVPLVLLIQIIVHNRIVPGASDNLSGFAALVQLSEQLAVDQPEDVEYVFVVTGAEEAGRCGAYALSRLMSEMWDRENTTILAIDTISHGDLRAVVEGELIPILPSRQFQSALQAAGWVSPEDKAIRLYHTPNGATDAAPFAVLGYDSIALVRIDPASDLPHPYHTPDDNLANLRWDDILGSIDYAERLTRELVTERSYMIAK